MKVEFNWTEYKCYAIINSGSLEVIFVGQENKEGRRKKGEENELKKKYNADIVIPFEHIGDVSDISLDVLLENLDVEE